MFKDTLVENDFITITKTFYPKNTVMPDHCHDKTAISLILSGSMTEGAENAVTLNSNGSLIIKPESIIHRNIYVTDCSIICLYVNDLNVLSQHGKHITSEWSTLNTWQSLRFVKELLTSQKERHQITLINEFLNTIQIKNTSKSLDNPPRWLSKIKEYLENNFHEPIRTNQLSASVNRHPVYVARAFRKYYHCSIKTYLHYLRLSSSISQIAFHDDDLLGVAIQNGFSDQSHMNRKFKEHLQSTPTEILKALKEKKPINHKK